MGAAAPGSKCGRHCQSWQGENRPGRFVFGDYGLPQRFFCGAAHFNETRLVWHSREFVDWLASQTISLPLDGPPRQALANHIRDFSGHIATRICPSKKTQALEFFCPII